MKVVPLAHYLKGRSLPREAAPAGMAPLHEAVAPQQDVGEAIRESFDRGVEEGKRLAEQEGEQALAAAATAYEAQLAEERSAWAREQGEALAQQIGDAVRAAESTIADAVAKLMEPILLADGRKAAVKELHAAIATLLEKRPGATLRIAGPADLLDALGARLGEGVAAEFAVSASCEVRIEADDAVIETALAEWSARLAEVAR